MRRAYRKSAGPNEIAPPRDFRAAAQSRGFEQSERREIKWILSAEREVCARARARAPSAPGFRLARDGCACSSRGMPPRVIEETRCDIFAVLAARGFMSG